LLPIGVAVVVGALAGLEIAAYRFGFRGPTTNFFRDFAFGPKRGPVLYAGLLLALVGLDGRQRLRCLLGAMAIDLVFFLGRLPGGTRWTFGNGAAFVLVGIGGWALWKWEGAARRDALKGVGIGIVMVMATKVSDAFLRITALTKPNVLDEYVQTADHALGNPSWWVGRGVDATGVVGHTILQTVYIQLPLAAIIVVAFQLRKGWPAHHLIRTFLTIGLLGPICYLIFPVVGPVFAFGSAGRGWAAANVWPTVSSLPLHPSSLAFDRLTPRNCMPSLHTAWVVAIFVHTRREGRWLRAFGTFWMVCTLIATLGFGYHYGVDLVAGVVFSLMVEAALREPERGWDRFRVRLVLGGFATLVAMLASYRYLAMPMAEYPVLSGPILLGAMGAYIFSFYATFFAEPGSVAADWGGRISGDGTSGGRVRFAAPEAAVGPAAGFARDATS
jgi:hypothetical protein